MSEDKSRGGNKDIAEEHLLKEKQTFNIRRNNIKVDSVETGGMVFAHLFPKVVKKISAHDSSLIINDRILSSLHYL